MTERSLARIMTPSMWVGGGSGLTPFSVRGGGGEKDAYTDLPSEQQEVEHRPVSSGHTALLECQPLPPSPHPHNSMEVSRALPSPSSVMACPSVPLNYAQRLLYHKGRTPTTICVQGVPTHSAGVPLYEPLPVYLYTFYIVHS